MPKSKKDSPKPKAQKAKTKNTKKASPSKKRKVEFINVDLEMPEKKQKKEIPPMSDEEKAKLKPISELSFEVFCLKCSPERDENNKKVYDLIKDENGVEKKKLKFQKKKMIIENVDNQTKNSKTYRVVGKCADCNTAASLFVKQDVVLKQ